MDTLRYSLLAAAVVLIWTPPAAATPIDSSWDLLHAVENNDGQWFLDLLSESLRLQIESVYRQMRDIAEEDPGMAEAILRQTGAELTLWDLQWLTFEEIVSRLLESVSLPSLNEVISEKVSMSGRNAEVVFTWLSGYTMSFQLTWERSSWRVTGSPLLARLF